MAFGSKVLQLLGRRRSPGASASSAAGSSGTLLHRLRRAIEGAAGNDEERHVLERLIDLAESSGADRVLALLQILEESHGHALSRRVQRSVDAEGHAVPWITYPALEYIDQLDLSGCRVLETGAGNGTLFWAQRAHEVHTIEHDPDWSKFMDGVLPDNTRVVLARDDDQYVREVEVAEGMFDVIMIDGRARLRCAEAAAPKLSEGGFVVLDNSDWYPNTASRLRERGLIQVDFCGFGPVADFKWTTSLFLSPGFRPKPRRQPFPAVGIGAQTVDCEDDHYAEDP